MRRLLALTLILLVVVSGLAAQQEENYKIRGISSQIIGDQVAVEFTVLNSGDTVTTDETVHLFDSGGASLASQIVKPLAAGQSVQIILTTPVSQFPPASSQTLYAVVGTNGLPPLAQLNQGNVGRITVIVPETAAGAPAPSSPLTPLAGIQIDLRDPNSLIPILIVIVVVVVLLWVITVIIRALFSKPPTLPAWQPPYVITPLIDPNSTNGRRQLWQQHATSDTLPAPCVPGNYNVRKLLIGSSGGKLAGWRVTGMRIAQYDRYGRVARSQIVLPKGANKALDRAVRKSQSLDWKHAQKAVGSTAKTLTEAALKKVNKQNAILPLALDIRFVGMHGEVGILFELYGCSAGNWQEIDHWEPEMRVVNGSIQENFTYTLLGQQPQESRKQYKQRLQSDLTSLLAAMVQAPPPPPPAQDTAETAVVAK